MSSDFELSGLDAQNPLAFFATLGLLRVLDDIAVRANHARPRLAFHDRGAPTPVLRSAQASLDEITGLVLEDAARRATDPILQLAYDDAGNRVAASGAKANRDLKPPPVLAKQLLEEAARAGRDTADLAAAFFSELVQDNNGNTKPTALYFTAGQQAFLKMVDELRSGIVAADLHEALIGPWVGSSTLPSLAWDSSVARQYALRAGDPSKEKRGSVPAANWLGVIGLGFFPVTVRRNRLITTRVRGGWKDSVLSWPIWSEPASARTIAGLLRVDPVALTASERAAMGISQVFSARIQRTDQGGYGSFSPADVAIPRVRGGRQ